MNEYALEGLARLRIAEMRAKAERLNQIRAASPPRRLVLGDALIRMGNLLVGIRGMLW